MSREPIQHANMVTVSCIDGRWFQARKGSPALPATRVPLSIPEWEVRDAMARLFVAAKSLDSAPRLAKLLRLDRYKAALAFHHDATEHFGQVATRTKAHQTAANRLASVLQADTKGNTTTKEKRA